MFLKYVNGSGIAGKEELVALVKRREQENAYLKSQIEMYRRMQFGQKLERFEGDPAQFALPFEATTEQTAEQEEILQEKINYIRKRPNHRGRAALPSHLPFVTRMPGSGW